MLSVFLVAVAAAIIYTEMLVSYRIMMRSRAKLEAHGLAFDALWEAYNKSWTELKANYSIYPGPEISATPEDSVLSTNGFVKVIIRPENDLPSAPEDIQYWDIFVEVWPGEDSPLQVGTNALSAYQIRRYQGER
jgi:hypothetical protein